MVKTSWCSRYYLIVLYVLVNVPFLHAAPIVFPADIGPNVKTLYNVKGDNLTNDTRAIQNALRDGRDPANLAGSPDYYAPRPRFLYFPAGTYLVNDTFALIGQAFTIQGQGKGETVFKIIDSSPRFAAGDTIPLFATMTGNYCFRINFHDLTINTGSGNPGAVGLRWTANNVGTVENVDIISGNRQGVIGLDLSAAWPGPCLVKNLTVDGFDIGLKVEHHDYGVTMQNITLRNQNKYGLFNNTNALGIHGLVCQNAVPAVYNTRPDQYWNPGVITIINATFTGGNSQVSAIENSCEIYLRNIDASSSSYRSAVSNKGTVIAGKSLHEFVSSTPIKLWSTSPDSALGLPIKESPEFHDNNLTNWIAVPQRTDGGVDNTQLQLAFSAGKSTVYFRSGVFLMGHIVEVPAAVKRIAGFNSHINEWQSDGGLHLVIKEYSPDPLIIERLTQAVRVINCSNRTVVVKHGEVRFTDSLGTGDWFIEDCVLGDFNLRNRRSVWARQFNVETWGNPHTRIQNTGGGNLWIMGMKTEGWGPIIETTNGGATELFGGMLYGHDMPLTEFLKPGFTCTNARMSLSFHYSSYGKTGPGNIDSAMYKIMVRETRGSETRDLATTQLTQKALPLFVGFDGASGTIQNNITPPLTHQYLTRSVFIMSLHGKIYHTIPGYYAVYSLKGELIGRCFFPGAVSHSAEVKSRVNQVVILYQEPE